MSKKNMNNKKPVKKNKKPGKVSIFYNAHKKVIWVAAAAVCAVALLTSVIIAAVVTARASIPYNINLSKYIDVPQYMGITIKNDDIKKEFDQEIKNLLLKDATYEELTEGTIEEGYSVTIDAKGYLLKSDGTREETPFSSGSISDYVITDIGNHYTESGVAFSSDIQKAIIGTDIEATKNVMATVKYPDSYSVEEVKGKTAEFDITIKKVEKPVLPSYTDTYVLAKTGFKNIEEYEEALEKDIRNNLVWNTIVNGTTIKKYYMPMVDEYITEYLEPYNEYMAENEMTFEAMLKELGITQEEFLNERDTYAYGIVREEMILYYIARKENITVSDSEYKTLGAELAINNGYSSLADFEDNVGENNAMRSVLWEKVKLILISETNFE